MELERVKKSLHTAITIDYNKRKSKKARVLSE